MKQKLSKEQLQIEYDSGFSIHDLCRKYGSYIRSVGIETRSRSEATRLGKKRYPLSESAKETLREYALAKGLGGYNPHPNRGVRYKDIWFDSKWEVEVAKSLDENNIEWIRPRDGFIWTDKGNKYYPDFYLPKYGVYLDPKNDYLQQKDAEKICEACERNNIRVVILNSEQLKWEIIAPLVIMEA